MLPRRIRHAARRCGRMQTLPAIPALAVALLVVAAPANSTEVTTLVSLQIVQPGSIALQAGLIIQPPLRASVIPSRSTPEIVPAVTGISSPIAGVFGAVRIAGDANQAVSVTMVEMVDQQGPGGGYRTLPVRLQPSVRTADGDGSLGIAPGSAITAKLDKAGQLFVSPVGSQADNPAAPGSGERGAFSVTVQYD